MNEAIPDVPASPAPILQGADGARRILAWFAVALAAVLSTPSLASGPAPSRPVADYETRFLESMIDHHAMAVMMAQTCQQKAVHQELIALCQSMEAAQMQEIATMQAWLADWYGLTHTPQMTQGQRQRMERMAALSAADYEIAFMESMIRHHWQAIVRSARCVDRAYHPELVAMCEDVITAQAAEIERMRTWLCQWYGRCNYGPKSEPFLDDGA